MNLSPVKTEQYSLLRIQPAEPLNAFLEQVIEYLQGDSCNYLALNLSLAEELQPNDFPLIHQINEIFLERTGKLAIIYPDTELMKQMENAGILFLPTEHEAVEYLIMEYLEKQFLNGVED